MLRAPTGFARLASDAFLRDHQLSFFNEILRSFSKRQINTKS
jgi:hypothetical protein